MWSCQDNETQEWSKTLKANKLIAKTSADLANVLFQKSFPQVNIYRPSGTAGYRIDLDGANFGGYEFYRSGVQIGTMFVDNSASGGVMTIYTTSTDRLALGANSTEVISIINGSKVGIKDTSPSYELDVNGTTATTDFFLNGIEIDICTGDLAKGARAYYTGAKWTDVDMAHSQPARALSTTYQNTNNYPIVVFGSVTCLAANDNTNYTAYIQCKTDGSSPPTTIVQTSGINIMAQIVAYSLAQTLECPFYFRVDPQKYYRIDVVKVGGSSSVTLGYWNEAAT